MDQSAETSLGDACASWQGGRDIGSSLLRGAARVLTGIPHYFAAEFIRNYETKAEQNPDALANARLLLAAVAAAPHRTADEWCASVGLQPSGFAGRGLKKKPIEDAEIASTLASGRITMPLWGHLFEPDRCAYFWENEPSLDF